jgi:hypothetical protein
VAAALSLADGHRGAPPQFAARRWAGALPLTGLVGLERDVGWGVLASDLRHLAQRPAAGAPRRAPTSNRAA